jgi:hypothetical protein
MFTRKQEIDSELDIRLARLDSVARQGRFEIHRRTEIEREEALKSLELAESWLTEAHKPDTSKERRIRLVQRTEAESCIYIPKATLVAERIRLQDRLYRLSETVQKQWQQELAKYSDDKSFDEGAYRQLLRRLAYELAEAAESFERLSKQRATALFITLISALAIIAFLFFFFFRSLELVSDQVRSQSDGNAFLRTFPASLVIVLSLAGSMGAMLTTIRSLIVDEKARVEFAHILIVNMIIRIFFGALYSIVVVFALTSHILPVSPNTDIGLLQFFVVAAVAAGFSDQLFGQAISTFITSKKDKKPTKSKPS